MIARKTRRWIVLALALITLVGWGTLRSVADSLFPPLKRFNSLSESTVLGPGSETSGVPKEVVIPFSSSAAQIDLKTPGPLPVSSQSTARPEAVLKETNYQQLSQPLPTPLPEYTPELP